MQAYWKRLSVRERRLAAITGILIGVGLGFVLWFRATAYLNDLDDRIAQKEDELLNMTEQDALSASVNRIFLRVASAHSSAWTKEEIHDRLGREIYRLALKNPPPEGGSQQVAYQSRKDYLVQIPRLHEGSLKEAADGYREYQISFRIPPTELSNLVTFLQRLQSSRQLLRIDSLDLMRAPSGTQVAANLQVTRTVVGSPDGESASEKRWRNLIQNASFETWDEGLKVFTNWENVNCEVKRARFHATDQNWCLEAKAVGADAQIYQIAAVQSGTPYLLEVDIAALAPITVSVRTADNEAVGDEVEVADDGHFRRYAFQFNPAGQPGETLKMHIPFLATGEGDTTFYLDNVRLIRLED